MLRRSKRKPKLQPGEGRHRRYFWTSFVHDAYSGRAGSRASDEEHGNLVSSLTNDDKHMPVIDLDFDCDLLPSSTPGNYHLFLNKAIDWVQYRKLLDVLHEIGFINTGWYEQSVIERKTVVRKPGVYKDMEAAHRSIQAHLEKGEELFSVLPQVSNKDVP